MRRVSSAALPTTPSARRRVVVVGAGFGGLWTARGLANSGLEVLLIDRRNYHTFFPLLYQVAAAEIGPTSIAHPTRSLLRGKDVTFQLSALEHLDSPHRRIRTSNGWIEYDRLVLAMGSVPVFFGVEGAKEHAFALRTMDDAMALRHHLLLQFERAALSNDRVERARRLTFTIVGGGPTGVEYAGALAELFYGPLRADFPTIRSEEIRVVLVEAGPRLLNTMPERLSDYARRRLERIGVEVLTETAVSAVRPDGADLGEHGTLTSGTVVWTAGVGGDEACRDWGLPTGPGGRVRVEPTLQVIGFPDIFAIGDLAWFEEDGVALPQVAQTALQMGEWTARNIERSFAGEPLRPFRYKDLGMLAVIGRNAAVADLGGRTATGFPAWLLWLGIHIVKLIGLRNRALVLVNWAWNYLTLGRAARLIMPGSPEGGPGTVPDQARLHESSDAALDLPDADGTFHP